MAKKVKLGTKKNERCLIISEEKPQRLFTLFVPCLMTGAFYHTAFPIHACFAGSIRKWPITVARITLPALSTLSLGGNRSIQGKS